MTPQGNIIWAETNKEKRERFKHSIEQLKINIKGTKLKLKRMQNELEDYKEKLNKLGDFL